MTEETKRKISLANKGKAGWNKGKHLSEETKTKLRLANLGKHASEETKEKMRGHKLSEETRKKMSDARRGRKAWNKGIPSSEEARQKISESLRGKPSRNKGHHHTEEAKKRISEGGKGKKRSEGTRQKMSGENNHSWEGGLTPLTAQIRANFKYHQWRSDVFTRDGFTCQECSDDKGGNLEAHHKERVLYIIRENNIKTIDQALECEELWDIHNGITLCKECHKSIHKKKAA